MYDGIYVYGQHLPFDPSFSGWQRRVLQVSAPRNITEVKVYGLGRHAQTGNAYFGRMALYKNC